MDDKTTLERLCALMNRKPRGRMRTPLAKRFKGKVPRPRRDVAARYLRRFSTGPWLAGGSHVSRPDFGPMIAFPNRLLAYVERC